MPTLLRAFSIVIIILVLSQCALIATGTHQKISVVSSEPGSEVYVNGEQTDTTPCEILVRRSYNHVPRIEVAKKGFYTEDILLKKRINHHIWLNLFDLPGWIIDISTGAAVRYQQPDTVNLQPKPQKNK